MQEDNIVRTIRFDELVILFANKLCQKYNDPHHYDLIRQKMRQLGRFLIEVKKHDQEITDLFSVFYPRHYDGTILAVQSLAGLNEAGTGFKTPSLATSVGTLLKQVGKLCVTIGIKKEDKAQQSAAEDFVKLIAEDYPTSITRTALETQALNRRRTKTILPSKGDIQKLQSHLNEVVRTNFAALTKKFSKTAWLKLAQATLVSTQLFNRRRAGEIERIFIGDFKSHQKIGLDTIGDSYENFTMEEKKVAMKYVRFTIRGKLSRTVPVLLHIDLMQCCEMLLKHRLAAGVNTKNQYLFGIEGTLKGDYKYLRACELMRAFAMSCGAENPQTLRGTTLRKHIATMCVNFNLTDNEISDLANFLGHADKIHKENYRQPIICREILQISKLLEAVQGNEDPGDDSDDSVTNNESGPSCVQDIENDKNRPGTNNSLPSSSFQQEHSVLDQIDPYSSEDEPSLNPKKAKKKRSS